MAYKHKPRAKGDPVLSADWNKMGEALEAATERLESQQELIAGLEEKIRGLEARLPPPEGQLPSSASGSVDVTWVVNGSPCTLRLDPRVTLLDALREYIGLTGTKKGCDHGQCGACTVLVDGVRINSCLTLAVMQAGRKITTVEGLAEGGTLHPLQAAFIKHDAFPCGYCAPGQLCSAVGLLHEGHAESDDDIRELMSGNICRCGAYTNILAAIKEVRDAGSPRGAS